MKLGHTARIGLGVLLVWFAFSAHGLDLGEVVSKSRSGEPLELVLALNDVSDEVASDLTVGLASKETHLQSRVAYPPNAPIFDFRIEPTTNGYQVVVTSQGAFRESHIYLLLSATSGPQTVTRRYIVLLESAPSQAAEQGDAVDSSPQESGEASDDERKGEEAVDQVSTQTLSSQSTRVTAGEGDSLTSIIRQLGLPDSLTIYQGLSAVMQANPDAFFGGNMNRLIIGKELIIPSWQDVANVDANQARQDFHTQIADYQQWLEDGSPNDIIQAQAEFATGGQQDTQVEAPIETQTETNDLALLDEPTPRENIEQMVQAAESAATEVVDSGNPVDDVIEEQQLEADVTKQSPGSQVEQVPLSVSEDANDLNNEVLPELPQEMAQAELVEVPDETATPPNGILEESSVLEYVDGVGAEGIDSSDSLAPNLTDKVVEEVIGGASESEGSSMIDAADLSQETISLVDQTDAKVEEASGETDLAFGAVDDSEQPTELKIVTLDEEEIVSLDLNDGTANEFKTAIKAVTQALNAEGGAPEQASIDSVEPEQQSIEPIQASPGGDDSVPDLSVGFFGGNPLGASIQAAGQLFRQFWIWIAGVFAVSLGLWLFASRRKSAPREPQEVNEVMYSMEEDGPRVFESAAVADDLISDESTIATSNDAISPKVEAVTQPITDKVATKQIPIAPSQGQVEAVADGQDEKTKRDGLVSQFTYAETVKATEDDDNDKLVAASTEDSSEEVDIETTIQTPLEAVSDKAVPQEEAPERVDDQHSELSTQVLSDKPSEAAESSPSPPPIDFSPDISQLEVGDSAQIFFDEAEEEGSVDFGDPETALDLARAYIKLGEMKAAQEFIKSVLANGNEEQKREAKDLLDE